MNRTFYAVLANSLTASLTNTVVWFAVTFWVYLETESVLATSVMAGIYLGTVALSGFFLGSVVDRYRKKKAMMISSIVSLALYIPALLIYLATPESSFSDPASPVLWVFVLLALLGAIAGNMRSIAISTLVTLMIPEGQRDRANGAVGTVNGVSFLAASVFSGLIIGFMGIGWMMIIAIGMTVLALIHLATLSIPEKKIIREDTEGQAQPGVDIRGTIKVISAIPGLFALIFFNTFNNFLGGVFMALMDAYGLSLVSVQVWGVLWGVLSTGFIIGGLIVSSRGLGRNPLKTMLMTNVVLWTICIFFTIQPSIILLSAGLMIYMCLVPVVEAAEQTIIQRLIPPERQGRVFGFAQSIEQAASPLTAFLIGPVAEFIFIPFMTTGSGAELIGDWFGTGKDRGLALLFTVTGIIGFCVTLAARRSRAYRRLAISYSRRE